MDGACFWFEVLLLLQLVVFGCAPRIRQAGSSHPVRPSHHKEEEVTCDPSDATSEKLKSYQAQYSNG